MFLGYLAGTGASTAAGRLGDRFGWRKVLWGAVLIALVGAWVSEPDWLPSVLVGLLLVTVGFFGAHSVASSWVGRRSVLLPGGSSGQASALYLFAYYAGSSVGGALGGVAYDVGAWTGLALRQRPAPRCAGSVVAPAPHTHSVSPARMIVVVARWRRDVGVAHSGGGRAGRMHHVIIGSERAGVSGRGWSSFGYSELRIRRRPVPSR